MAASRRSICRFTRSTLRRAAASCARCSCASCIFENIVALLAVVELASDEPASDDELAERRWASAAAACSVVISSGASCESIHSANHSSSSAVGGAGAAEVAPDELVAFASTNAALTEVIADRTAATKVGRAPSAPVTASRLVWRGWPGRWSSNVMPKWFGLLAGGVGFVLTPRTQGRPRSVSRSASASAEATSARSASTEAAVAPSEAMPDHGFRLGLPRRAVLASLDFSDCSLPAIMGCDFENKCATSS